ncbi:hypothetical protein FK268_22520 [Tsukamurella sputi]|uniref:Uncharacterized protein n=1 Tax=Tsukamurella sputi TaxID=2591848 RepID=A0A5C5RGK8_9ACTN|nr:hypothetical protein [Tsukamurella sputi]TWS21818.1 hypothetical protein FK268_22520 [Tsukamurella sputi]
MDPTDTMGEAGKSLYVALSAMYTVDDVNLALVLEACRIVDQTARINDALDGAPLTVVNARGDTICNPMIPELRQLSTALRGIFNALGVSKLEQYRSAKPRGPAGQLIDKHRELIDIQNHIAELQRELDERQRMEDFLAGKIG